MGAPDEREAPPAPSTGDRPPGPVSRARLAAGQARARVLELFESERARNPGIQVVVGTYQRDRSFAGALLAGGLAFRFFLWLLPFGLLITTLLGLITGWLSVPVPDLGSDLGLPATVADTVQTAVAASDRGRLALLILGLGLTLWAGMGVVKALRMVHAMGWQIDVPRQQRPLAASSALAGFGLLAVVWQAVSARLYSGSFPLDVLVLLLEASVLTAAMVSLSWVLPHPAGVPWTAFVPGSLLITLGVLLARLATWIYFIPRLDRVDDLYGALGAASVILAWLYIVARLFVAGPVLNATRWQSLGERTTPRAS